jgi:hypothetical protein
MKLSKILIALLIIAPVGVFAAPQTYVFPTWDDIDQTNPPTKNNDEPDPTDRIAFDGSDELITAFTFCSQLGYSYTSHLADSSSNPSAVYEPPEDEWEQKGNKDTYLQIVCDDGVVSSSTADITVDVTIPNQPDYTDYFKFFMIIFSSMTFMGFVVYFTSLVRKFL